MHTTPASLLHRLRSASSEDWSEFIALYTPLLYHWARQLGVENDAAADLLQDVFVKLLPELPRFRYDPNQRFRGWLWTVFKSQWLMRKRQVTRQGQSLGPEILDNLGKLDNIPGWEQEEYRDLVMAPALRLVQAEFHATTWQACWAVTVEERPPAEVADELGMTVNAVYVSRSRVLRRLREKLAGLLD